MPHSTRFGFHWVAPLAMAGLLAGCHSSRSAFQFAPAAPYASSGRPTAAPVAIEAPATPALAARPTAPAATTRPLPAAVRRLARRLPTGLLTKPASRPAGMATPAATLPAEVPTVARLPRRHTAPAHTQESGLGRIALFFLAVVLAVLAGLGALVSLVPGVSFWGGVGLAAAGLLVLFLLYSLLSGGSKKKSK